MYYLYDRGPNSLIDKWHTEQEIINTMGELYMKNPYYVLTVIQYDDITTEPKLQRTIHNIGEYEKYLQEFNIRQLRNKSCMQLKKEILDMQGVETPKVLKPKRYNPNLTKNGPNDIINM